MTTEQAEARVKLAIGATLRDTCPECGGTGWINLGGAPPEREECLHCRDGYGADIDRILATLPPYVPVEDERVGRLTEAATRLRDFWFDGTPLHSPVDMEALAKEIDSLDEALAGQSTIPASRLAALEKVAVTANALYWALEGMALGVPNDTEVQRRNLEADLKALASLPNPPASDEGVKP